MNTEELITRVRETRDPRSWVREKAVVALVTADHGHLVSMEILANTPVRSRYKGRFCSTRHINTLHGVVLDNEKTVHSVWFCPAAENEQGNNGSWTNDLNAGWKCSTCIHTQDYSEMVQNKQLYDWVIAPTIQTSNRDYNVPSGDRAQSVLAAVMNLGIGSLEEILAFASGKLTPDPEAARRDLETTSNTVYRLFKTGVIQKFGRGKKAVYCVS